MGFAVSGRWLTGWQSGSRRIHLGGTSVLRCCARGPATSGGYSLRYIYSIFSNGLNFGLFRFVEKVGFMTMQSLRSKHIATLNGLYFEQTPTLPFTRPENGCTRDLHSASRFKRASDNNESCSLSRRVDLQARLNSVKREIEAYVRIEREEKARFDRDFYMWTAEDRIEWQETQLGNAERLRELLKEHSDLQSGFEGKSV
ncbi:hypothetical protein ABIF91_005769 [Bradyrhizobium sp. USDA 241]